MTPYNWSGELQRERLHYAFSPSIPPTPRQSEELEAEVT